MPGLLDGLNALMTSHQRQRDTNRLMASQYDRPDAPPMPSRGNVVDRAGLLPLGTYEDGSTTIAWPGFIAAPVEGFNKLLQNFSQPGYETGNPQTAEQAFDVAGGAATGGLGLGLFGRGAPRNALAAFGPNWKPNQEWIHGTSGTHTSLDPSYAGTISQGAGRGIWLTEPNERIYANEYAQRAAYKTGGNPRIVRYQENGVSNPLEVRMNSKGEIVIDGKPMADFTDNLDVVKYAQNKGHDAIHWVDGSLTDPPSLTVFNGRNLNYLGE